MADVCHCTVFHRLQWSGTLGVHTVLSSMDAISSLVGLSFLKSFSVNSGKFFLHCPLVDC